MVPRFGRLRRIMVLSSLVRPPCLVSAEATPRPDDGIGFLYVNNNGRANSVRAFTVSRDGHLASLADSPFQTFGAGGSGGFPSFPSARPTLARKERVLYANNIQSGSISAFMMAPDGVLSPLVGSPFAVTAPEPLNPVEALAAHPLLPLLFAADATGLVRVFDLAPDGGPVASSAPFMFVGDRPEDLAPDRPEETASSVPSG